MKRFLAAILIAVAMEGALEARGTQGFPETQGLPKTTVTWETQAVPEDIAPLQAPFEMPQLQRPVFPDRSVSITRTGAKEGFMCTDAIRKAVDKLAAKGGGTVIIPKGYWLTGRIVLKSGINLHLEEGAEVRFSGEIEDYSPVVRTRYEGIELFSTGPMIYALGAENIALTGKGKFIAPPRDCNLTKACEGHYSEDKAHQMNLEERIFDGREGFPARPPQFFGPVECRNILVEGVSFEGSLFWNIAPVYCDGIIIRDVMVSSVGAFRTDGIDFDSSRNALVEYVTLNCGDDCFTMKAGRGMDGYLKAMPTENIVIRHCRAINGTGGIVFGSETAATIRNVYVTDCDLEKTEIGIKFKTRRPRGGGGHDLWFEDIRIGNTVKAIEFDMLGEQKFVGKDAFRFPVPEKDMLTPSYHDIHMKDISVGNCDILINAHGLPESPIENVDIENLQSENHVLKLQDVGTISIR